MGRRITKGDYMGYSHYFTFKAVKRGTTKQVNANFAKAVQACQALVYTYNKTRTDETRLAGYTAHTKPGAYGGLKFNGTDNLSHEDFIIREHYKENVGFNFCKTNQKPYDEVVTACLCILKHYLGDNIDVDSDGDSLDWVHGLELARKATGVKTVKMPSTIKTRIGAVG